MLVVEPGVYFMVRFVVGLLVTLFALNCDVAQAENPWGPECETVEQCVRYLEASPKCTGPINACMENLTRDGLYDEFKKFERKSVPPLLELLKSRNPFVAARAAQILWSVIDHIGPSDHSHIVAAWRKNVYGTEEIVSKAAPPEFAREVLKLLREAATPEERVKATWTLGNLRDWDETSTSVASIVAEQIECSVGQPCDPFYAEHQFGWLKFIDLSEFNVLPRVAEALENPKLGEAGRLNALQFFVPRDYMRPDEKIALPVLDKLLNSSDKTERDFAVTTLSLYGDERAKYLFLQIALDPNEQHASRLNAIANLTSRKDLNSLEIAKVSTLVNDRDWDVRRYAVVLLRMASGPGNDSTFLPLMNNADWLTTFSVISALQYTSDKGTKQAIGRMATEHWHPAVRKIGRDAQLFGSGNLLTAFLPPLSANAEYGGVLDSELVALSLSCEARAGEEGYEVAQDEMAGPESLKQANDARAANLVTYKNKLLALPAMKDATKPGLKIGFNGLTFEGTATAKGTGKLVVSKNGANAKNIIDRNIVAIFEWNKRPYAITGRPEKISQDDGFLMQLYQQSDGEWSFKPVLRLTGMPEVWVTPDGTIGIIGTMGVMLVSKDGKPAWVGCPAPGIE